MNMWWFVSSECVNACVARPRPCWINVVHGTGEQAPSQYQAAAWHPRPNSSECAGLQWPLLRAAAAERRAAAFRRTSRLHTVLQRTWKYLPQTRHTYTLSGERLTLQHFSKSKSSTCAAGQRRMCVSRGLCTRPRPVASQAPLQATHACGPVAIQSCVTFAHLARDRVEVGALAPLFDGAARRRRRQPNALLILIAAAVCCCCRWLCRCWRRRCSGRRLGAAAFRRRGVAARACCCCCAVWRAAAAVGRSRLLGLPLALHGYFRGS